MTTRKLPPKLQSWVDARKRHHLSHAHVQMARELGMDPRGLGKLDNHHQERWKASLPQFIERLYRERFGRDRPEAVRTIEQLADAGRARDAARKAARRAARSAPADPTPRPIAPAAPPAPSPSDLEQVTGTIAALARELVDVQREARALGLFAEDRDLLACPTCGLMEDVLAGGLLVTYQDGRPRRDTGLRFADPASPGAPFTCPLCRSLVPVPPED